jgi:hypothetical protein
MIGNLISQEEIDNFFSRWNTSTKGNYYGMTEKYVYVISNIDHDTKNKIDFYNIVRSHLGLKEYQHLGSCKTLDEAKKFVYSVVSVNGEILKVKKTKFEI